MVSQPKPGTASRKADHIRINLDRDVAAKGVESGFDDYRFVNCAFPELDLADVETGVTFLGRRLRAPILISCMTGGTPEAQRINGVLAQVAQRYGLAMGLGSGRALLEHPELKETFAVRASAPDVVLLANLGAVQLNKGCTIDDCRRLVDLLQADALALHVNAIQEALQPEGDTCFRGLLEKIEALARAAEFPIVVKEVGWGIAPDTVRHLFEIGVAAVDLAGAGGTSWSEVERHRIAERWRANVAAAFSGWGIPSAECIRSARSAAPGGVLIASGGIRTGIDLAKALALGADIAGIAGPFLRAADAGLEAASDFARELCEVLRVAMFALGKRTAADLRGTGRLVRRSAV